MYFSPFLSVHELRNGRAVLTYSLVTVLVAWILHRRWSRRNPGRRLPGPTRWPLIGNTLSVPKPYLWTWHSQLSKIYGPIFRMSILLDELVVISDPKIAEELFGRRALNYSSRKDLLYTNRMRSTNRRMLLMPYGEDFTKQRTAMQLLFRPDGIESNRHRQKQQAVKLLIDFLDDNGACRWNDYLKYYSSGVALGIAFGMSVFTAHERMPLMIGNTETLGVDLTPGQSIPDIFPWADCLPEFLAPWRARGRASHEYEASLFGGWAEESRNEDPGVLKKESLVGQIWKNQRALGLDDKSVAYLGGSVGEAGTNTTQCMLSCFLYVLTLYPGVGDQAQQELDAVVGDNRLPDFSDMLEMPHLWAFVKEVFRFIPVTPLALPHFISEDDEYHGYHIPGKSLAITSIWNMHRDASVFPNPDTFDPKRFYCVGSDGKVPRDASLTSGIWSFGFGRRSCPGRRLGVDSIWLGVAHFLWAFNISKIQDPDVIDYTERPFDGLRWRDSVNIEPKELPIIFEMRSPLRAARIREEWEAYGLKENSVNS
ncbi:cytochrome P450 [Marasmius fiardii PR-910]|nr:cytochrome P450 [Marasmius fiardii PR-910]